VFFDFVGAVGDEGALCFVGPVGGGGGYEGGVDLLELRGGDEGAWACSGGVVAWSMRFIVFRCFIDIMRL